MASKQLGLFLSLLPKLPLVARAALLHLLHLSPQSKYLDLRTAVTVAVIRSFIEDPKPRSITSTQGLLDRGHEIKGRVWVSRYTAQPPPEVDVRDALLAAIGALREPGASTPPTFRIPEITPVEAEWTGYRAAATPDSELPRISEEAKYGQMMKECTSPATILYFHGGAYWLLDPAFYRPTCKKLAKLTGGRCYSVRYRLAPQNPFPAAILDALVSYLTLLYPPPGAFHEAVKPEHVVFSGDSAGGNLSLALTQTLLELRRQNRKVTWLGQDREVPLPSGIAVCSPWMDITVSSRSCETNGRWDYLPVASDKLDAQHRPPCAAWPASPPRKSVYVDDGLILHPLVTLLMARSWRGAPPVYMCTGWELLADEDKYVAGRMHASGVPVVFEEYEAMPHCFALMFTHLAGARRCLKGWTDFIGRVVAVNGEAGVNITSEDDGDGKRMMASSFTTIKAKSLMEVPIDPDMLSPCTEETVREQLHKRCKLLIPEAPIAAATTLGASAKL